MEITEALNPVFDENNEEVKQLYSDYMDKLQNLYMKVYKKSRRDMAETSRNMYAAIEMVFQCSVPGAPDELRTDTVHAMHYVEVLASALMKEDEYSAILALTKFIRHKQISLIVSMGYTEDEMLQSIPSSIRNFGKGKIDFARIVKIVREKSIENFKTINASVNGLIDMISPYYPWDKLDTDKLIAGEYNIPKF